MIFYCKVIFMKLPNSRFPVLIFVNLLIILLSSCFQGVRHAEYQRGDDSEPFTITIMTTSFTKNPATSDSPVVKAIEAFTDTRLNIIWVNNSSYEDQMNLTLASGNIPDVMLITSKSYSVVNAARAGAFLEIGSRINNYKNLRQMKFYMH